MRTSFVAGLLLATSLIGQNVCSYSHDNNASTGGCNVIPFGEYVNSATWKNQKYQQLIPAASIGATPMVIRELAFASCVTGVRKYDAIKITLDQIPAGPLSMTFASNLGATAVVVLDARNFTWPTVGQAWNRIGMQRNFLFIPQRGDVVIEVEVVNAGLVATSGTSGFHSAGGQQRIFAFGYTGPAPVTATGTDTLAAQKVELCTDLADASTFSAGCPGLQSTSPVLGYSNLPRINSTNFSVNLSGAAVTRPALFLLGVSALPPLNLGVIGLPNCNLYCSTEIVLPSVTDATGARAIPLPIANDPTLLGARFFNQFFVLDAAGSMQGTNFGRVLVGT